jgi:hypothetical protein
MIDIDSSLQAIDSHKTFWVEFDIEGEAEKPAFEIEVKQRKQRKAIDAHIRPYGLRGDDSKYEVVADYFGLALALSDDVINWRGFSGAFDKPKLKKWLEAFGACAESFAQAFKGILEQYEAQMLKHKDALEKN